MEVVLGAAVALAALHLSGERLRFLTAVPRSRWLSFAGGTSVAYVFVHLLPEVAAAQRAVQEAGALRSLERHAYLLALAGLVVFYGLERHALRARGRGGEATHGDPVAWLAFGSYALYNALIGYLLNERTSPAEAALYVAALGLHLVVNDWALRQHHGRAYHDAGRWVLAAAVVGGALAGMVAEVGEAVLGLAVAFLAGGIVLNVLKEELPAERDSSIGAFAVGAGGYAILLLLV